MRHRCRICNLETDSEVHAEFPFCSERCRERDLGNWASERYVVSEPIFSEEEMNKGGPAALLGDFDKPHDRES